MIPHLGERLAQLRQARGWTREELAERLGTSSEYVRHMEMGHQGMRRPSFAMISNIATVFDITERQLMQADWQIPKLGIGGRTDAPVAALEGAA